MVGSKKKKKKRFVTNILYLIFTKSLKERERERDMDVWGASE